MAIILSAKQFCVVVLAIQLVCLIITTLLFTPNAPPRVLPYFVHNEECHVNIERVILNLDELLVTVQGMHWEKDNALHYDQNTYNSRLHDIVHGIRIMIESALYVASKECLPHN